MSTPTITEFDPTIIKSQIQTIETIENFNYRKFGVLELLLSGAVGSSKSLVMAHIAIIHCLRYPRSRVLLARQSMPDLKSTILQKVLEHMEGDLIEGKDFDHHESTGAIRFYNGSEIICRSWGDKRYRKFRSLELSAAIIEELTENSSEEFEAFYPELKARVGRLSKIPQSFILIATNPDAPSHAAYEYFIAKSNINRKVIYSVTSDNPFLPPTYVQKLLETYTAQEAQRMIYGQWVELKTEIIYYAFSEDNIIDSYQVNPHYPIIISYDFNIGMNKPMSVCFFQYIEGMFYFFDEIVISGSNTLDTCDEMIARNLVRHGLKHIVRGDASGRAKSSKYNRSDYEIINKALSDYGIDVEIDVPLSNPPVRKRHLLVNGQLKNAHDEIHVKITRNCETIIKGLRLTKLKKGGQYIEDDSPSCPWQHITTALGYGIVRELMNREELDNFTHGGLHGDDINRIRGTNIGRRF